jgi:hypothetical protein
MRVLLFFIILMAGGTAFGGEVQPPIPPDFGMFGKTPLPLQDNKDKKKPQAEKIPEPEHVEPDAFDKYDKREKERKEGETKEEKKQIINIPSIEENNKPVSGPMFRFADTGKIPFYRERFPMIPVGTDVYVRLDEDIVTSSSFKGSVRFISVMDCAIQDADGSVLLIFPEGTVFTGVVNIWDRDRVNVPLQFALTPDGRQYFLEGSAEVKNLDGSSGLLGKFYSDKYKKDNKVVFNSALMAALLSQQDKTTSTNQITGQTVDTPRTTVRNTTLDAAAKALEVDSQLIREMKSSEFVKITAVDSDGLPRYAKISFSKPVVLKPVRKDG